MNPALIIFVRKPVLGRVKTRLAAAIGNEKALAVYTFLLRHTRRISERLPIAKFVFYADEIDTADLWDGFEKRLQNGNDLGERMENAFKYLFKNGYTKVCIIGSDCYTLSETVLKNAFTELEINDVVIGPATDGGYYLLGMQSPCKHLFQGIRWSSNSVCTATIKKTEELALSIHLLPVLSDVDEEKDITFNY
jgi:uncharacterized protein